MRKRYRNWLIGLAIGAFIALVMQDLFNNPGPGDLPGGFEELAFVRNEQNKGGIVRIYAFRVSDTAGADYQGCGDLLPHNEYGSVTKVYFFDKNAASTSASAPPKLQLDPPHFDTSQFHPVATYIKGEDGVGRVYSGYQ